MPPLAKILIVDDEPLNVDLLEQELADCGNCEPNPHAGGVDVAYRAGDSQTVEAWRSGEPTLSHVSEFAREQMHRSSENKSLNHAVVRRRVGD